LDHLAARSTRAWVPGNTGDEVGVGRMRGKVALALVDCGTEPLLSKRVR
jgi:hypothetical protein